MIDNIKWFVKYLTSPKITIYLKSGNKIKTRVWPSLPHAIEIDDLLNRIKNQEISDICDEKNRECVCIRKWWQKWG